MFSNLSNWINTNIPQSIPTVNLPNMPNVHMPKLPDLFGKNKNPEEATDGQEQNLVEASLNEQAQLPTTSAEAENDAEAQADLNSAEAKHKFGLNAAELNQNAQKAIGAAKEMSSNIGSKIAE